MKRFMSNGINLIYGCLISFILIFWQSMLFIDIALGTSLIIWIVSLIFMFKEQKKIFGGQL